MSTIAPKMAAAKYELKLLPADQLKALATAPPPQPTAPKPALQAATEKKHEGAATTPPEMPKPPDDANQQSSDGFLVNGSVNNAATSQFSLNQAFGNRRFNTKSLYNGGFGLIFDNAAARMRGRTRSADLKLRSLSYNRITLGFTLGGPLKIPHLLPRGPNFFVGYQWTRNNTAQTNSALVPTLEERVGHHRRHNLPGKSAGSSTCCSSIHCPTSPATLRTISRFRCSTAATRTACNRASIRRWASAISSMATSTSRASRADDVNLFSFVDTTDTLGFNANINWSHRFNQHLFLYAGYHFSRLRTQVSP